MSSRLPMGSRVTTREAAGEGAVPLVGGADSIREALDAGKDELSLVIAPVVLGEGQAAVARFERALNLESLGVRQTAWLRSSTGGDQPLTSRT